MIPVQGLKNFGKVAVFLVKKVPGKRVTPTGPEGGECRRAPVGGE